MDNAMRSNLVRSLPWYLDSWCRPGLRKLWCCKSMWPSNFPIDQVAGAIVRGSLEALPACPRHGPLEEGEEEAGDEVDGL
eukprot:14673045-Alexandrium_andersonii.AAC.1